MKKVVLTEPVHADGIAILEQHPDINLVRMTQCDEEALLAEVADAQAILVRSASINETVLAAAPLLEIVSRHGVGCDNVAVSALNARQLPMAIAAGANSTSVAEHVLMMMMVLTKQPWAYDKASRQGRYQDRGVFPMSELSGKTILIIGFGRIGRKLAPVCKAFGMRVVVIDVEPDRDLAGQLGCEAGLDFRPFLSQADFVSLHVPLDESTRDLIGTAEIEQMPAHAILINCARGGIVNEAALVSAMQAGRLGGFGTDVFDKEPPAPDDPILSLPNSVLSPHVAALTDEGKRRMAIEAAQNIVDCFENKLKREQLFNAAQTGR